MDTGGARRIAACRCIGGGSAGMIKRLPLVSAGVEVFASERRADFLRHFDPSMLEPMRARSDIMTAGRHGA